MKSRKRLVVLVDPIICVITGPEWDLVSNIEFETPTQGR